MPNSWSISLAACTHVCRPQVTSLLCHHSCQPNLVLTQNLTALSHILQRPGRPHARVTPHGSSRNNPRPLRSGAPPQGAIWHWWQQEDAGCRQAADAGARCGAARGAVGKQDWLARICAGALALTITLLLDQWTPQQVFSTVNAV